MAHLPLGWLTACLLIGGVQAAIASEERADELLQQALSLEPNVERGAQLYQQHCRACHGQQAQGNPADVVPALARQRQVYMINQLVDFVEQDRGSPEMHRMMARTPLTEPQAWVDVAAYLNSLPAAKAEKGNGERVQQRAKAYKRTCLECHGNDARGDVEGSVPSLRDQHYSYLLSQMRSLATDHRLNIDEDLKSLLNSLSADDMMALADYLSALEGPVRDLTRVSENGVAGD